MNKKLFWGAFIAFDLVVVGTLAGFALPREWRVERTEVVAAPAETVYWLVSSADGWMAWNDLSEMDPAAKVKRVGTEGVGAGLEWTSDEYGDGRLVVTETVPAHKVTFDLTFGELDIDGTMVIEPAEGGTKLTWTETGDLGVNPIARWAFLFMRGMVEDDFEDGFDRLHAAVEKKRIADEAAAAERVRADAAYAPDAENMDRLEPALGAGASFEGQ